MPAKFCFRAIASFDRFMTEMKATPPTTSPSLGPSLFRRKSLFTGVQRTEPKESIVPILDDAPFTTSPSSLSIPSSQTGQSSFRQVFSSRVTQAGSFLQRQQTLLSQRPREGSILTRSKLSDLKQVSNDTRSRAATQMESSQRMAGESRVYEDIKVRLHL